MVNGGANFSADRHKLREAERSIEQISTYVTEVTGEFRDRVRGRESEWPGNDRMSHDLKRQESTERNGSIRTAESLRDSVVGIAHGTGINDLHIGEAQKNADEAINNAAKRPRV